MAYFDEGEESNVVGFGTHSIPLNEGLMSYGEKRKSEYPDIGAQLDDLFKQGVFSAEMTARIQAVKDRYNKETNEEYQAKIDANEAMYLPGGERYIDPSIKYLNPPE